MKSYEKAWIVAVCVTLLATISCSRTDAEGGKGTQAKGARAGAPVTIAPVTQATVPITLKAIGNVESIQTVSIRAQVQGVLERMYFKEGQDVKKGDKLFLIDPRTYEQAVAQAQANLGRSKALVQQAEATLAKDEAQAKLSSVQEQRYKGLVDKGVVSKDQYDQVRTTAVAQERAVAGDRATIEFAKADVRAAEAAVQDAQVKLGFSEIRAPIGGRVGSVKLKEGNLISVGGDPLVVINQISPIYVSFAIPEQYQATLRELMGRGRLTVTAATPQSAGPAPAGTMTFVENSVDPGTGTIKCTATFANERHLLWPGEFVNITITTQMLPNAILVPTRAVQTSQRGNYVYVVKNDMTAEQRPVTTSRQVGDQSIIDQGVKPGEQVITDGHLKVTPGGKVQILKSGAQAASVTPAGMQGL